MQFFEGFSRNISSRKMGNGEWKFLLICVLICKGLLFAADVSKGSERKTSNINPVLKWMFLGFFRVLDSGQLSFGKQEKLELRDKARMLKTWLDLVVKIYDDRIPYSASEHYGKIANLSNFIELYDPLNVDEFDFPSCWDRFDAIFRKLTQTADLPRAFSFDVKNSGLFEKGAVKVDVEDYLFGENKGMRDTASAALMSMDKETLAEGLLQAFAKASVRFVGSVSGGRFFAKWVKETTARMQVEGQNGKPDSSNSNGNVKVDSRQNDIAKVNAIATDAEKVLGHIETLGSVEHEQQLIEYIKMLLSLDFNVFVEMVKAVELSYKDVVQQHVFDFAREEFGVDDIDPEAGKSESQKLKEFFYEYVRRFPQKRLADIMMSLLELPRYENKNNAFIRALMLAGPLIQAMLQTMHEKYKDQPTLSFLAKALQSNGIPLSDTLVQRVIESDPNHYDKLMARDGNKLVFLGRLGVGKMAQANLVKRKEAEKNGNDKLVVRIIKPGADEMLEVDKRILLKLAPLLSEIIRLPDGKRMSEDKIRQLLLYHYENHRAELNSEHTVKNQRLGSQRLPRTITTKTHEGEFVIKIKVPDTLDCVPGSKVMIQSFAESSPLIGEEHKELSKTIGTSVFQLFFEEAFLSPVRFALGESPEKFRPNMPIHLQDPNANKDEIKQWFNEIQQDKGYVHRDEHAGNVLVGNISQVGEKRFEIDVNIIDYGLVTLLTTKQIVNLITLAVGAKYKVPNLIAESLWLLQPNLKKKETLTEDEKKEMQERYNWLVKNIEFQLSQNSRLEKRGKKRWMPSDWILFSWGHGYIEVPTQLIGIEEAVRAVESMVLQFGNSQDEVDQFEKHLISKNSSPIVRALVRGKFFSHFKSLMSTYMRFKIEQHNITVGKILKAPFKMMRKVVMWPISKCIDALVGKKLPYDED